MQRCAPGNCTAQKYFVAGHPTVRFHLGNSLRGGIRDWEILIAAERIGNTRCRRADPRSIASNGMNALIVDPDPIGAGALEAALARRGWAIQVEVCTDTAAAWLWLERRHPSVVFLELNLPDGAGMEFLVTLKERYPGLPVVLWTDYALLEDMLRLKRAMRPLQLHNRTVEPGDLAGGVRRYLAPKPESRIHGIDPGVFLELLARERKSCRLRMSAPVGYGDIFLLEGALVHAELMGLEGEAAFLELMTMPNPELTVYPDLPPRIQTIHQRLPDLLAQVASPRTGEDHFGNPLT